MLPGENVCALYLNMEYNYEDAILVSQRYVDNGGFSTISLCTYSLPSGELIPDVGMPICSKVSKWWKSKCAPHCSHKMNDTNMKNVYSIGRIPTSTVVSVDSLDNGDKSVQVRSYQQLQTGDKLSTGHGQKGIAVITPYHEMPVAMNDQHGVIVPDVVIAMSSIVTRQTNGQLYESALSLTLMANGTTLPQVVQPGDTASVDDEFNVCYGSTGRLYVTATTHEDGSTRVMPTKATLGYVRIFNQTQMTRERHHVSHHSVGSHTLRTPVRRTRGGGISWGEMEVQAAVAAGLSNCVDEIVRRGDMVQCNICTRCQRLGLLCTCTTEDHHIRATLPYDTIVFDTVNAIVYNGSNKYELEADF